MEITEVKVILKEGPDKKLKAYATITLDNSFVVRNIKIIKGNKGLFVAMPSRKMREACSKCHYKNVIRSKFCNQCGSNLPVHEVRQAGEEMRQTEHRDIAHPITLECREYIQKKVLSSYEEEIRKSPAKPDAPKPVTPRPETPPAPIAETKVEENKPADDSGDIQL
ncbi:MAG: septation protein SpoVG family protein [Candidatus Omnitrophota bacterium]